MRSTIMLFAAAALLSMATPGWAQSTSPAQGRCFNPQKDVEVTAIGSDPTTLTARVQFSVNKESHDGSIKVAPGSPAHCEIDLPSGVYFTAEPQAVEGNQADQIYQILKFKLTNDTANLKARFDIEVTTGTGVGDIQLDLRAYYYDSLHAMPKARGAGGR